MNNGMGRMWELVVAAYLKALFQHLLQKSEQCEDLSLHLDKESNF